ncbi:Piwi domain-containing protein [Phlyctochytrium arcticum]|nr:Piwi domain-containing protein [Phlyctochytrium arcticum]
MATTAAAGKTVVGFPSRPGPGTAGKKVSVTANFWQALKAPARDIHQYDVDIDPQGNIPVNRRVFSALIADPANKDTFAGKAAFMVYDGRKIAYSPIKLPFGSAAAALKCEVAIKEDDGASDRERKFMVTIKETVVVDMGRLQHFLEGKIASVNTPQDALNVYDCILRHYASGLQGCVPSGRGWYLQDLFSRSPQDRYLGSGAEAWNGCKLSMRPGQKVMYLNADLSTTAFLVPGPLIEVARKVLEPSSPFDPNRDMAERDIIRLERNLKNFSVLLNHRTLGRKKYKIAKFTTLSARKSMFDQDGKKVSVEAYFKEQYNMSLKYPNLPCIEAGPRERRVKFPMEICDVPPGQALIRKLDDKQTQNMIRIAQQRPLDRLNRTSDGINALVGKVREGTNYRDNAYLQAYDIQLAQHPASLDVRCLEPPLVAYSPKSREKEIKPRDGNWNLKDKQVAFGKTLASWSVLIFAPQERLKQNVVEGFVKQLVSTCKNTGLNVTEERPPLRYGRDANVEQNLKAAFLDAGDGCKKKPQMILVVLPDTNPRRYAEIKRVSDTVIGVITQCVQSKHVLKANVQYCANVCLKMNVKLGGFNAFLPGRQLPFISEAETLVLGADITHPGPGEGDSKPSIAAMVGSMDAQCARFAATLRIQRSPPGTRRNDIIQDVYGMTMELLRAFYRTTNAKPKRIIFYRDGASEGQFAEIRHTEVQAVKRACADIEKLSNSGKEYNPPVTFIIVTKRHHTRFFPKKREDADRSGNCMPGTVIDKNIVHPVDYDFYLQSHAGLQGTSRSAHYHVLHDENNLTPDVLQNMTYRLCYLYARCTRSVSVCPPIYYADLVAARARFHFQGMEWSEESCSGAGSEAAKAWDEKFARVKDDLKSVMYYM